MTPDRIFRPNRLVLLLWMFPALLGAGDPAGPSSVEDRRLFALVDQDDDQVVPLGVLADLLGVTAADNLDPRMLHRLAVFDPNQDGQVSVVEFCRGQQAMVDRQVNRMMATDVNDDGMLTMKEFSLGMPDPRGKVNQDGFTKRQLRYFQQYEPGPDGAVSESKIRDFFTSSRRKYFEIDVLTRRVIRQLDRNQDGGLDLNEYARWITDDGRVTEAVETSFKKEFSRYKGKLTRRSFRNHLVTLDSDATKSFRQRLDQIEGQQDESTAED